MFRSLLSAPVEARVFLNPRLETSLVRLQSISNSRVVSQLSDQITRLTTSPSLG